MRSKLLWQLTALTGNRRKLDPLAPIIADALGVWNAANYETTTRKVIKNSVAAVTTTDPNLLTAPRRMFNFSGYWGPNSNLTVTDANTTAPDGSTEATTITSASSLDWFIQKDSGLPTGTYTICISVKSLSGSSADFRLGNASGTLKTATTSWQRFSVTITGSDTTYFMRAPSGGTQANFAICDFEIFAGSSDLNVNALSAKPLCCQNQDLILGSSNADSGISVSGGVVAPTTLPLVMMPSQGTLSAYTVLYVAKRTAVATNSDIVSVLSKVNDWSNFSVGPGNGAGGTVGGIGAGGGGQNPTGTYGAGGANYQHLWTPASGEYIVGCHRGNGSAVSSWLNGRNVLQNSTFSGVTIGALRVMCEGVTATSTSGLSWQWVAVWNRALTDTEVKTASQALMTLYSVPKRLLVFVGTSITAGGSNNGIGDNLNPHRVGANYGVSGDQISDVTGRLTALDGLITNGPPLDEYFLVVELGTNDLNAAVPDPTGKAAALATLIDGRRTAGWSKIIATTVLPRTDAGGASDVDFNTARAAFNTTVRGWVGGRINAVSDWAAEATMGPDGASDNATFYGDKVHPTTAGQALLEAVTRAALNSVA